MQLLIELGQLLALARDLAHSVQHRRMVTPTEELSDLRKALLGQFLGQVHRDLPWPRNRGRALLAVHVGDLYLVIVGHRLLDVLDRDLPVLY